MTKYLIFGLLFALAANAFSQTKGVRAYGIEIGILKTGINNSITDVSGVSVGHVTLIRAKAFVRE